MQGMLYVVDVRMQAIATGERLKHRLLLVGCEESDIERKLRWIFDQTVYSNLIVTGIEKVREKVHYLSTTIIQETAPSTPNIERADGTTPVPQAKQSIEKYDPHLFAVGITTTMLAKDREHALRKVGNALVASATQGESHSAAKLSDDSTITVEQIAKSSGYALPRDVSKESNRARMVRG